MTQDQTPQHKKPFRRFFIRGLGILLPTVLTIWIVVAVYNFVLTNIAQPINVGVQKLVLLMLPSWYSGPEYPHFEDRLKALQTAWSKISVGGWAVLDLIGIIIAIVAIYIAGLLLGSFIGRRIYARGEQFLQRIPVFKQVYPYVKQVTDFVFGENKVKDSFNKVVAVEYPRKGLWSVGMVTGDTMQFIQDHASQTCVTVFVPSSPTPFTGYVITVPEADTIPLPITIEEALRFTVSGGVIIPASQVIRGQSASELETGRRPTGLTGEKPHETLK